MLSILGVLLVAMLAANRPAKPTKKGAKLNRKVKKLAAKGASATASFAKLASRAGLELGRELDGLEKTFMCPQLLEEPELFPDTTSSRAVVCVPFEVPVTFTNNRASGTISRDVFNHFTVDGASTGQSIISPRFTVQSVASAQDEWTADPDLPGHEGTYDNFNNFTTAHTEATFTMAYGQWADYNGEPIEPRAYPLSLGGLPAEFAYGVPCEAGKQLTVRFSTADTTANRWTISVLTLADNLDGTFTLGTTTSATFAGGASVAGVGIASVNTPAGTVAYVGFVISNVLGTNATTAPSTYCSATLANVVEDVGYPVGGGSAFNFLRALADSCRITGFAFHLRNDTPDIYRQGEVVAWQQRDDAVAPMRSVEVLSTKKGRYAGRLAEGAYGWLTLRSAVDAQTAVHIAWQQIANDVEANPGYVDIVHWALKVADSTNQALVWVLYPVVEYRSDNPFLDMQVGLSRITACEVVANVLAHFPAIMNNDSHWEKIRAFLGDSWDKVWNAATPFIRDVAIPAAGNALIAAL